MTSIFMHSLMLTDAWMADLSQAAAGSLIAAIWQGILLAAAAGLGLRMLPRTPAAVRFAVWFGVFLLVTVLPVISLMPHGAAAATSFGGQAPLLTLDSRWCLAIVAVWATASLLRAISLVAAAFRVRALWRRATPVQFDSAQFQEGSSGPLQITRRAQVCTSDEVDRPTVIGFFSPKILIPGWLLDKLTPAELQQIVLHESGHLGRADDWMNLLQKLALVIFPLNPALAWVERRLCFERELACDERVLHATGAPKAYAACLAALAEYRLERRRLARGLALVLGALGRESELGRRVRRILRCGERMRPLHAKLVLGGAMLGLMGAATGLEHCPQVVGFSRAQEPQSIASIPAPVKKLPGDRYGYQPVVFHPKVDRVQWKPATTSTEQKLSLQKNPDVPHETLLKATIAATAQTDVAEPSTRKPLQSIPPTSAQPARIVRTVAVDSSNTRQATGSRQTLQPAAFLVTQWVVVESFQGADGSHVILTTAVTSGAPAPSQADQPAGAQQVRPYAAVPVRDGWLVFQL